MAKRKMSATWLAAFVLMPLAVPAQGQEPRVEVFFPAAAMVTPNLRDLPTAPPWQPGIRSRRSRAAITRPPRAVPPPARRRSIRCSRCRRGRRSPSPGSADPELRRPGLHRRQPARHRGRHRPRPLRPVDQLQRRLPLHRLQQGRGTLAAGPTAIDRSAPAHCANGLGDPIVLFDQLATRWLLSEFSTRNRLCIYISQTSDPDQRRLVRVPVHRPQLPRLPQVRRLAGRLLRLAPTSPARRLCPRSRPDAGRQARHVAALRRSRTSRRSVSRR